MSERKNISRNKRRPSLKNKGLYCGLQRNYNVKKVVPEQELKLFKI